MKRFVTSTSRTARDNRADAARRSRNRRREANVDITRVVLQKEKDARERIRKRARRSTRSNIRHRRNVDSIDRLCIRMKQFQRKFNRWNSFDRDNFCNTLQRT